MSPRVALVHDWLTGMRGGEKCLEAMCELFPDATLHRNGSFTQRQLLMPYDRNTVRLLYRKLLAFYPQALKEQLGESMEQTFNDLYNEKRQEKRGLLVFVLWTFIETAMRIFRERLLLITEGVGMQTALGTLGLSGGISFLLILHSWLWKSSTGKLSMRGSLLCCFLSSGSTCSPSVSSCCQLCEPGEQAIMTWQVL